MGFSTRRATLRSGMALLLVMVLALGVLATPARAAAVGYFSPPYWDTGRDTNGNGLYDYLDVSIRINVTTGGTFFVGVNLWDQNFTTSITAQFAATYLDRSANFTASLDGQTIRRSGIDGPYWVEWYLYDENFGLLDTALFATAPYSALDFEAPPVLFVPPASDVGVDTNGNGLFDVLLVNATLNVTTAGDYAVSAYLHDPGYTLGLGANVEMWFDAGLANVTLSFDGTRISTAGVDGPYEVDLQVYDSVSFIFYDQLVHMTQAYFASEFENPPARLAPPYHDSLNDSNGDGLWDWIFVDVSFNVSVPGYYQVRGQLSSNISYSYLGMDYAQGYFGTGLHTLRLQFSTMAASQAHEDGPYPAYLNLLSAPGLTGPFSIVMSDVYYTAAYSSSDFAPPAATIGSPITDQGVDRSSPPDGKYDVLQVTVPLDVALPGTYEIWAYIEGVWAVEDTSTYLNPGAQTMTLSFSGAQIAMSGIEGPYTIDIELSMILDGRYLLLQVYYPYVTGPYSASDFAPVTPAFLTGTVTESSTGLPVSDVWVEAYNYTSRDDLWVYTDADGTYSLPLYAGDWILMVDASPYQGLLLPLSVGAPSTTLNVALDPSVQQTADVNLTFSDWNSAARDRWWNFTSDNATARQYYDWYFGNRDGYLSTDEFLASQGNASNLPEPVSADTSSFFRVDGQSYRFVPGSDSFTWGNIEGSIFDPSPMTGLQTGSFTSSLAASSVHTLSVNVSYDLWYDDRIYNVQLPPGYVATDMTAAPGVVESGLGTGTVVLNPGADPTPSDGNDSVWITITATGPDAFPPTVSGVQASPDPAELGASVTIGATVTDDTGVDSVSALIHDPEGATVGNFTMTPTTGDRFEYTLTAGAVGTYTYEIWAQDAIGNGAVADGSFTIADTTAPAFGSVGVTPDPAELGSAVTFMASVTDLGSVASVVAEVRDSGNVLVGTFNCAYDSGSGLWETTHTFTATGTYSFVMTAADVSGNTQTDSGSFVVRDTTAPSVTGAAATPNPVELSAATQIFATVTDAAAVSSVKVEIRDPQGALVGNYTMNAGTAHAYTYSLTPSMLGTYTYTITATDSSGNVKVVTGSFVVQDTTDPVASAGPDQSVTSGTTVTLDGSASTDNDAVASYSWTFDDGGTKTLTGAHPTYTFSHTGTFTVTLTVTDPSGNTATDTMTVTVTALPPTTGTISGTVTDAGGHALANAAVALLSGTTQVATATSDSQGHFTFTNVAAGTYTLRATASGYDASTASVTVVAGQTAQATVSLTLTTVTPLGVDWLPVVAIVVAIVAVAGFLVWYLRRGKK